MTPDTAGPGVSPDPPALAACGPCGVNDHMACLGNCGCPYCADMREPESTATCSCVVTGTGGCDQHDPTIPKARGRLELNLPERQNVDEVVRDLVSKYPGVIARADYLNPDAAMVRLNRFGVDWVVSIVRAEVTRD